MHFLIHARYQVSCFFTRTLAKCAAVVSNCLTDELTSIPLHHSCPVLRMEDRHMSADWFSSCVVQNEEKNASRYKSYGFVGFINSYI
jgi:hypothetical protein